MTKITFEPVERPTTTPYRMNLSALVADGNVVAAGRTTSNRFAGAPIRLARERLPQAAVSAVLINNRVANVAAPTGYEDAAALSAALSGALDRPAHTALSISTGIIGWSLPRAAMEPHIVPLVAALGTASPVDLATAIMTTDRFPKVAARTVGGARIVGIAKGAGMVEPNMGTMLAFLCTDAELAPEVADRAIGVAVESSFNAISVDGDQSTSDIALLLANGRSNWNGGVNEAEFTAALTAVCQELAVAIVRNGEGTAHVLEVTVSGVPTAALARAIGKRIVNSPLVKTAVYGNDPNVGRIVGAAGAYLGSDAGRALGAAQLDLDGLRVAVEGQTVYRNGAFVLNPTVEAQLSAAFKAAAFDPTLKGYPPTDATVRIELDFGRGAAQTRVFGSDLSEEYVHENADYRS